MLLAPGGSPVGGPVSKGTPIKATMKHVYKYWFVLVKQIEMKYKIDRICSDFLSNFILPKDF